MVSDEAFDLLLRRGLVPIHLRNVQGPIRVPAAHGAFPFDFLLAPLLVVPDACRLCDDILYAARHEQRTVLVTAANAGLLRLFCAQHVIDEVDEHGADWTRDTDVSQAEFLDRWNSEYLPLIRIAPVDAGLLSANEEARIHALLAVDPEDAPSAALALLLEAFYLSKDVRALMVRPTENGWAVYLTNGLELIHYRGLCSKQLALRYVRRYARSILNPRRLSALLATMSLSVLESTRSSAHDRWCGCWAPDSASADAAGSSWSKPRPLDRCTPASKIRGGDAP